MLIRASAFLYAAPISAGITVFRPVERRRDITPRTGVTGSRAAFPLFLCLVRKCGYWSVRPQIAVTIDLMEKKQRLVCLPPGKHSGEEKLPFKKENLPVATNIL